MNPTRGEEPRVFETDCHIGSDAMHVCAASDASDEEILAVVGGRLVVHSQFDDPDYGWASVPKSCGMLPGRTHYVVLR